MVLFDIYNLEDILSTYLKILNFFTKIILVLIKINFQIRPEFMKLFDVKMV